VLTAVAAAGCLWQLSYSLAHVGILRMDIIRTIVKTVIDVQRPEKRRVHPRFL
jgi:hypothetical protein